MHIGRVHTHVWKNLSIITSFSGFEPRDPVPPNPFLPVSAPISTPWLTLVLSGCTLTLCQAQGTIRMTAKALPCNPAEEVRYAVDTYHTDSTRELQRRARTIIKKILDTQQEKRQCGGRKAKGFIEEEACSSLILKNSYDLDIYKHREGPSKWWGRLNDLWMLERTGAASPWVSWGRLWEGRSAGKKAKGGWGKSTKGLATIVQGEPWELSAFLLHPHQSKSSLPFSVQLRTHFLQEAFADLSRRALSSAEFLYP